MALNLFDLSGRVAIVTGGSQGLGRGIAMALADAGADVVVAARRPEQVSGGKERLHTPVDDAVRDIEKLGRRALGVTMDVREADQVERMVRETMDAFGRIDILVNNAGGSWGESFRVGPLLEISEHDLDETFRLNVKSVFLCARAVTPTMRRQGKGVIINVASVAGRFPAAGRGAYGAAKAAVINLTMTMAQEWAPEVRVNVLVPGSVATPHRPKESDAQMARGEAVADNLLGREGSPEEFGAAVVFLASDAGGYANMTGLDLHGGRIT